MVCTSNEPEQPLRGAWVIISISQPLAVPEYIITGLVDDTKVVEPTFVLFPPFIPLSIVTKLPTEAKV